MTSHVSYFKRRFVKATINNAINFIVLLREISLGLSNCAMNACMRQYITSRTSQQQLHYSIAYYIILALLFNLHFIMLSLQITSLLQEWPGWTGATLIKATDIAIQTLRIAGMCFCYLALNSPKIMRPGSWREFSVAPFTWTKKFGIKVWSE